MQKAPTEQKIIVGKFAKIKKMRYHKVNLDIYTECQHKLLEVMAMIRPVSAFARFWSSPLLSVILGVSFLTLGGIFLHAQSAQRAAHSAPQLTGYDWSQHPETLLVVYPLADACSSCNLSIAGWAERGLKANLDVVVIANKPNSELKQLRESLSFPPSPQRLSIVTGVAPEIIKRFSIGDKIGGVRVHNGRIIQQQTGGSPPVTFFTFTHDEVGEEVKT